VLVPKAPPDYTTEASNARTAASSLVHWLTMMNGKPVK
jgi:hypothetical protein